MKLIIGYLYANQMNIYGDTGNIIALQKRCSWRGIDVKIKEINIGSDLEAGEIDLFFFGGGQDQSQIEVSKDLIKSGKGDIIKIEIERGVPLLAICGGYQLLGDYYQPFEGKRIEGLNIFSAYTEASHDRMIGDLLVKALIDGDELNLIGFENHSGKTYLKHNAKQLGNVVSGFGNNGQDKTEGCVYKNAIGCYMHGPLLPKNPRLADYLIQKALEIKYRKNIKLSKIDNKLELLTHANIIKKIKSD